jgi:putative ABC transport system permease protein
VTDEARMEEAKAQIAAHLRLRHGIEQGNDGGWLDDFRLTTIQDILGVQQDAARTFAVLLAALAVVSLVVGGFGIMNVMLVSVTERTREIGVRMAVGARQQDVVLQFLLEAALLSLAGGMLGILVGLLTIPLAAALNKGLALLDPASIPVALAVALATGIIFGLYPALRTVAHHPDGGRRQPASDAGRAGWCADRGKRPGHADHIRDGYGDGQGYSPDRA